MSEHDELQEALQKAPTRAARPTANTPQSIEEATEPSPTARVNFAQWEIGANDCFMATGGTRDNLPPGVYRLGSTQRGIVFQRTRVMTDKLIDLQDTSSAEIIAGIRTFWASEDKFTARGILYKRGVLLWGPPGSGKTVTVSMLINELLGNGGTVILCDNPQLTVHALAQLRRIEPNRRLIVVEEDIEEIMRQHGEHELLALLDGENQIANVVHIATTNYVEELGARIVNRPSRFDEVRKIGMPNDKARRAYLLATVPEFLRDPKYPLKRLDRWVEETDGMSIAHLRELVVAVFCLSRDYDETIERLKKMQIKPRGHEEGFKNGRDIGMGASAKQLSTSVWTSNQVQGDRG